MSGRPVNFRANLYPQSAEEASAKAAEACDEFFDGRPYEILSIDVRGFTSVSGSILYYEATVEATGTP